IDPVQNRLEGRVEHSLPEDVQRLDQRHPRLQQRGKLLIEYDEFLPPDWTAARSGDSERREHPAPVKGKNEKALFLQLAPKACFALGDVNALNNFAAGRPEPTTEFHRNRLCD